MSRLTNPELDKALGAKVRAHRIAKGLTQKELGAAIGVAFQQIQKYEEGINRISAAALVLLADALDMDAVDFLPRKMRDGRTAPDPMSALGGSIAGLELATICGRLEPVELQSVLSVAKAIAGAKAVVAAAQNA